MSYIIKKPDTYEKLDILSRDSQYDLACACGTMNKEDHRKRSEDNRWIYPVTMQDGRRTFLFKTLVSNACRNDCKYCPLRSGNDTAKRCSLSVEETVRSFLQYYNAGLVSGIFLTSGVEKNPDSTMDKLNGIASVLRYKNNFRGYMHLKVIPGASDAAVEEAVSLANAVSVNIETPGEDNFGKLCNDKNYLDDIIRPMKLISRITNAQAYRKKVKQTTQFIVGASDETDREIVKYTWALYERLNLGRVYFSAYQRGLGEKDLPGEISNVSNEDLLRREHRLYQMDFLFRKYGFNADEIPYDKNGNLFLDVDPKEAWAKQHPDFFPLNLNTAGRSELLRVPGLGHVTVDFILKARRESRLRSIEDIGSTGRRLLKAGQYIMF
ncbi:MAG: radical SAM protein [Spirochaetes bacterium]|nr:radical SAM protein [Spirochaetota bacterium]